jgi:esterase/lipase superfamily enzyme
MRREYCRWYSQALGREMEMLVFGQDGLPVVVFPTARGRFYEFEDCGMVGAVAKKIGERRLQLFCVDSVDAESWYNRDVLARGRIARQVQFEQYVIGEVVPFARKDFARPPLAAIGCGFGGYHAVNTCLRYPSLFTRCLSMSGTFDLKGLGFLDGYYDDDCYFNLPMDYLPNLSDTGILDCVRRNTFVLATGVRDSCWSENEQMAAVMWAKRIEVRMDAWGDNARQGWPLWQRMVQTYL